MDRRLEESLKRNITHEQKVRLFLFRINKNIQLGTVYICAFIFVLILSTTESLLFKVISYLGIVAFFFATFFARSKDAEVIKEVSDYYEKLNKREDKKNAKKRN